MSIVSRVDATAALADLTEISSQVEAAVVVDGEGATLASTLAGDAGTERLARAGVDLFEAAQSRFGNSVRGVTQLEVALREGCVFVAREAGLGIVARTSANPSSGLVFYDLRTCLRSVAQAQAAPKRKPRRKAAKQEEGTVDA